MKGFIFGLLVGAAGAIAGLHYTDQAHIDKVHELAGIEAAAPAVEEAAPAMEEAADMADDAMADDAMADDAMADDAMADDAMADDAMADDAAAEGETP